MIDCLDQTSYKCFCEICLELQQINEECLQETWWINAAFESLGWFANRKKNFVFRITLRMSEFWHLLIVFNEHCQNMAIMHSLFSDCFSANVITFWNYPMKEPIVFSCLEDDVLKETSIKWSWMVVHEWDD